MLGFHVVNIVTKMDLIKIKETIGVVIAMSGGFLSYIVGGFDYLLIVFITILVIDTLSGMLKAWSSGTYKSSKFRSGLWKKCGYLIAIMLSVQIDTLATTTGILNEGVLRGAFLTLTIANESLSIIENLSDMGVVFPSVITNALEALKKENKKDEQ